MENNRDFDLIGVRRFLHQHPELSGREYETAKFIEKKLLLFEPDQILTGLGGYGLAAIFDSGKPGKTVMLRAELDALPITEESDLPYASLNKGVSHKCGHDGHIAILLGVASRLRSWIKELNGIVILLFQPAEETAQGAKALLNDKRFRNLQPDYIFALHNLPGFPKHCLILKEKVFAAASIGMKFFFKGKTSHAGHPENGNSPLFAMQSLLKDLQVLSDRISKFNQEALITIIYMRLGEEAFGTSPGEGVIMATLRASEDKLLKNMAREAARLAKLQAKAYKLIHQIELVEEFAATINDPEAFNHLHKAAVESSLQIVEQKNIFSWTEDFSFFSREYKTAFFGLGCGEKYPQLHNPDYDFPDDLILTGCQIFNTILRRVLK